MIVSPSLLSADFGNLERDIDMINRSDAEWLHLDVMDGVFVPNISFGFPVLEAVAKLCKKQLDIRVGRKNRLRVDGVHLSQGLLPEFIKISGARGATHVFLQFRKRHIKLRHNFISFFI